MKEIIHISHKDILANRRPIDFFLGPAIYFLLDKDEIVYVGRSKNAMSRIQTHQKDKYFDSYAIFPVDKNRLIDTEIAMIALYRPRYNKAIPFFLSDDHALWAQAGFSSLHKIGHS